MNTYPKSRIDALSDGIFAFAMTLLILEVRLPPDIRVESSADLLGRILSLWPDYLAYLISFFVLAAHWRADIALRRHEQVSERVLGWTILYLFFITSIPFTTSVVDRHGELPPAIWLYAANMIAVAGLAFILRWSEIVPEQERAARVGRTKILAFAGAAALSVVLSFVAPAYAMYVYLLNIVAGPVAERLHRPVT